MLLSERLTRVVKFCVKSDFVFRALFDYDGSGADLSGPSQPLPFHFGDILHVSSAGEEEWWPARHLSPPPPNCPEVGVIPSRRRLVKPFSLALTDLSEWLKVPVMCIYFKHKSKKTSI